MSDIDSLSLTPGIKTSVKNHAVVLLNKEVKAGRIARPEECSDCSATQNKIHGHHDDYSKPLDVRWLCPRCHKKWHKINGQGANSGVAMDGHIGRLKKKYCIAVPGDKGMMNISKSIVLLLEANNWSQDILAEKMDVHPGSVANIIRRGSCHSDTLTALAKAYGLKVSEFVAAGEQ